MLLELFKYIWIHELTFPEHLAFQFGQLCFVANLFPILFDQVNLPIDDFLCLIGVQLEADCGCQANPDLRHVVNNRTIGDRPRFPLDDL
jgi:hypothetical protein